MKPIYQHVKDTLLKRLQRLPLETRLPSDRDLAREFNVAILTVSRAMNELAREGFLIRRPRSGTFLASHERVLATHRDDARGAAGDLLFAYPHFFSHQFFVHVRLAEEYAVKNRLRLVEYKLTHESTPESLAAVAAGCANLRGIMIMSSPPLTTPQALKLFATLGKPVVFLSTTITGSKAPNVHWRDTDWFEAGRLAASSLLEAGHRRIAWVNHEAHHNDDVARGMRQVLKDLGRPMSDLVTIGNGIQAWTDSRESGYHLTLQLLDGHEVTGAYYDSIAGVRSALLALWERGLRAPEHLSLIANGNQSGDEAYLTPPLTTIDADWEAEMREAFAIVLGTHPGTERGATIPVRVRPRGSIIPYAGKPAPAASR
jgi:DNA-binding LacI/PurR family transcriptional regulator